MPRKLKLNEEGQLVDAETGDPFEIEGESFEIEGAIPQKAHDEEVRGLRNELKTLRAAKRALEEKGQDASALADQIREKDEALQNAEARVRASVEEELGGQIRTLQKKNEELSGLLTQERSGRKLDRLHQKIRETAAPLYNRPEDLIGYLSGREVYEPVVDDEGRKTGEERVLFEVEVPVRNEDGEITKTERKKLTLEEAAKTVGTLPGFGHWMKGNPRGGPDSRPGGGGGGGIPDGVTFADLNTDEKKAQFIEKNGREAYENLVRSHASQSRQKPAGVL